MSENIVFSLEIAERRGIVSAPPDGIPPYGAAFGTRFPHIAGVEKKMKIFIDPQNPYWVFAEKFYKRHRNLVFYGLIGCVGASLDFCIFSALTIWSELHHQIANIISISVGIITNFFLNFYFNFKSKGNLLLRMISFYLVGLSGIGLSALLLHLFIKWLCITPILAKFCTIFFVTIMQYTLNKLISFRKA